MWLRMILLSHKRYAILAEFFVFTNDCTAFIGLIFGTYCGLLVSGPLSDPQYFPELSRGQLISILGSL